MSIKTTISLLLLFVSSVSVGQKKTNHQKITKPIILFVCEHGAARSTIAAAYFNKFAQQQNLDYVAVFRGTDPDTVLTPATQKGLMKDSFDVQNWKPILVSERDMKSAYKIVSFDCKLPIPDSVSFVIEQWNGIPPISKDYDAARNQIVEKVKQLITQLPKLKKRKK
jgi:arsenate reductase (thioredoxin)